MNATELAKQHGPSAGVAAVVSASISVALSGGTTEVHIPPTTTVVESSVKAQKPSVGSSPSKVSLVSCGDMRGPEGAQVVGNNHKGTIRVGPGANTCTVVFDRRWSNQPKCVVKGGRATKLTATDLVIVDADKVVTYECSTMEGL